MNLMLFMRNLIKRLFKTPESLGFREVFEQSFDAMIQLGPSGDIVFFNKAAESLWGYSRSEVIGDDVDKLFDGYKGDSLSTQLAQWAGSVQEVRIRRKDGKSLLGSMSLSKISLGDEFAFTAIFRDATEIQEERERYLQILGQAIDAVVSIDENNCVTFYNAAAEQLFGYGCDEVMGQNVKMLVPMSVQPHHDQYINANRTTGVNKIVGKTREVEINRKDGSKIWGQLSVSKVKLGNKIIYTGFLKDITPQRRAFEILKQTLEQAIDAVVSIDENNCVTFFNTAAEKLFGYSRDEVLGNNVKMLVPMEIQPNHDQYINANRTTGVNKIVGKTREVEISRKDGSKIWGLLSVSKIYLDDKMIYTGFLKNTNQEHINRANTNSAMDEVLSSGSQISQIATVLNDIAAETKLLSLNISIVAASAGDSALGITVLASELQKQSEIATESAAKIEALIAQTKTRIDNLDKSLKNLE